MILELFITLCIISLTLLVLGYFTEDAHYAYVGLFFFFLLGLVLLTNQLEYETGTQLSTTYSYNNGSVVSTSSTATYQYTNFTGDTARWFGFLLSISAGFGMSMVWFSYRRKREEARD